MKDDIKPICFSLFIGHPLPKTMQAKNQISRAVTEDATGILDLEPFGG